MASLDCKVPIILSVCFGKTRGCCGCTKGLVLTQTGASAEIHLWILACVQPPLTSKKSDFFEVRGGCTQAMNLWDTALFTLSVPTSWNRNSRSICAILFRPASGEWSFSRHFQCLLVNDVHGQSQFFLFIQNGICICCMSDARTLGGFSCETSCLLVVKTKERIS